MSRYPASDWAVEDGVRCVVAPCCAFTFDARHTDGASEEYSCPLCEPGPTTREPGEGTSGNAVWQLACTGCGCALSVHAVLPPPGQPAPSARCFRCDRCAGFTLAHLNANLRA